MFAGFIGHFSSNCRDPGKLTKFNFVLCMVWLIYCHGIMAFLDLMTQIIHKLWFINIRQTFLSTIMSTIHHIYFTLQIKCYQ